MEEDDPDPAIAVSLLRRSEPARAMSRLNARKALRSTWEDRVLRAFFVLSAVSLWLTVTLTEPRFLVMLFLALGAGTWWHRHRRASASVDSEIDVDDWL